MVVKILLGALVIVLAAATVGIYGQWRSDSCRNHFLYLQALTVGAAVAKGTVLTAQQRQELDQAWNYVPRSCY